MAGPGESVNLFRWLCLGVAVVFLGIAGWMINDIRLQVRRSAEVVKRTGENVNEHLPTAVEKSRQTAEVLRQHLPDVVEKTRRATDTLTEHLPEIVDRVDKTTEVVAELADDIKQLKELAGLGGTKRDENLVAYTNGVLKTIAASEGTVGAKKVVGKGLKSTQPAAEWVAGKRKWTTLMLLKFKSKKEVVIWLTKGWYIEFPNKEPVPLLQWLIQHHDETKALGV
jgi:hypothetical protein